MELLAAGQDKKRADMAVSKMDLGPMIKRAQAKIAADAAEIPKVIVKRPRSVTDLIQKYEDMGKATDLSPRLRKPMKLSMAPFASRPRMSSLPASVLRVAPRGIVQ